MLKAVIKRRRLVPPVSFSVVKETITTDKYFKTNRTKLVFQNCHFSNVVALGKNIVGHEFIKCTFTDCVFDGSNLSKSKLLYCEVLNSTFKKCNFTSTSFRGSNLENVNFESSSMSDSVFFQGSLKSVNLKNITGNGIANLPVLIINSIDEYGNGLVFLASHNKLWYKDFEGTLEEFRDLLNSNIYSLKSSLISTEVVEGILSMMNVYRSNVD